jgi:hypothetical protein
MTSEYLSADVHTVQDTVSTRGPVPLQLFGAAVHSPRHENWGLGADWCLLLHESYASVRESRPPSGRDSARVDPSVQRSDTLL